MTGLAGAYAPPTQRNWQRIDLAVESVPTQRRIPALIRFDQVENQLLVPDLAAWLANTIAEPREVDEGLPTVWWSEVGTADFAAAASSAGAVRSALRSGRPTVLRSRDQLAQAPSTWGLYRIHQGTGPWYVGISSNLRARLGAHQRAGRLDFSRGDVVELLLARAPDEKGIVSWKDLADAEKEHIRRLRSRGEILLNQVGGGNGHPPRIGINLPDPVRARGPRITECQLSRLDQWGQPIGKIDCLDIDVSVRDDYGTWRILVPVHDTSELMAVAVPSDGVLREIRSGAESFAHLAFRYARGNKSSSLADDLSMHLGPDWRAPLDWPTQYFVPVHKQLGGSTRTTQPALFDGARAAEVRAGKIPDGARDNGFSVDPAYAKIGINATLRVRNDAGNVFYLKVEENEHASRASILAGLVLETLRWRGIGSRPVLSRDRSTLLIAPVGGAGIEDRGDFKRYFHTRAMETSETLPGATRPHVLRRVGLADLQLREPDQVLKFVVLNGIWGNTDRHGSNLRYGWYRSSTVDGLPGGHLLPIDHGRTFFNSSLDGNHNSIAGDPLSVVLGQHGNPHQLLRAFAELAIEDPHRAEDVIDAWLKTLLKTFDSIAEEPIGKSYEAELSAAISRTEEFQTTRFIDSITSAVAP